MFVTDRLRVDGSDLGASHALTEAVSLDTVIGAVQAASGPAGRVEPTCLYNFAVTTFVQPLLRAFGNPMHGGLICNPCPTGLISNT